jgi:Uma2 family endonuclease
MTHTALAEKLFTVAEYIEFEENSEIRHEFHEGHLYPIEATSIPHNRVIQNAIALMRPVFLKRGCILTHENVKLQIIEKGKYVYPDIMLSCHEKDKNSLFIMRHPSLIVEVLSKSTADYDKGTKFSYYQTLHSIQYYLLIESRWQSIELYSRTENKKIWTYQSFTEPSEIIEFPKLDFQMSVDEIYQDLNIGRRLSYLLGEIDEPNDL